MISNIQMNVYGHQLTKRWPDKTTAIFEDGDSYKRYDVDMWHLWNPSTPWVIGEEPEASISRWLDLQ
jgi:hypothetical protein